MTSMVSYECMGLQACAWVCAWVCDGVKDASPALGRALRPARVLTRVRESALTAWSGQIRVMDAMRMQEGWGG